MIATIQSYCLIYPPVFIKPAKQHVTNVDRCTGLKVTQFGSFIAVLATLLMCNQIMKLGYKE